MDKSWQIRSGKVNSATPVPAQARLLQRKCACSGNASEPAGECEECRKKKLHRKAAAAGPKVAPPIVHEVLNTPGQALGADALKNFEPTFNHDFGRVAVHHVNPALRSSELTIASPADQHEQQADRVADSVTRRSRVNEPDDVPTPHGHTFNHVRVHTDARAAESARAVNALAYTVGNHIVFGPGQYQPATTSGRHLLAHELAHVEQQSNGEVSSGLSSGGAVQRKLAVDPAKFAGPTGPQDKNDFEKLIQDDLKIVTGMNLAFSSDQLIASGKPTGGSATAQKVLNMALNDPNTIFIDPRSNVGAQHNPGRGIEISTAKLPLQLKALRPGITIIHELTHQYASALKPANYDKDMKQLTQKAAGGAPITPDESEQLLYFNPTNAQSDENIARSVENQVQQELGLIKRIHYGFPMEFPKGSLKSFAEFQAGSTFIYLEVSTYDIFTSPIDYFTQGGGKGPPVANPADFKKVVKGSAEYKAIQQHLL